MQGAEAGPRKAPRPHLSEVHSWASGALAQSWPLRTAKGKPDALLFSVAVDSCSRVLSQGLKTKGGSGAGGVGGRGEQTFHFTMRLEQDKSLNCHCSLSNPSHVETREA